MRHLVLGVIWLGVAMAPSARATTTNAEVCVHNFLADGNDPCAMGVPNFGYIVKKSEPDLLICVRTYVDDRCKFAAESFDHVIKPNGERTCTINYHQPPISAMCASDPGRYIWVDAYYPDDDNGGQ